MVCVDTMTYCKASTSLIITDATETHLPTSHTSVTAVALLSSFQTVLIQVLEPTSLDFATIATLLLSSQTILIQALVPTSLTSAPTAMS